MTSACFEGGRARRRPNPDPGGAGFYLLPGKLLDPPPGGKTLLLQTKGITSFDRLVTRRWKGFFLSISTPNPVRFPQMPAAVNVYQLINPGPKTPRVG